MSLDNIVVFAGKHDTAYVQDVCDILDIEQGDAVIKDHPDSDERFQIKTDVGGKNVYFVLRYHRTTRDNNAQILDFANAALHRGAEKVHVFETYMGNSRQERISRRGEAVTLQVKAQNIIGAGVKSYSTFAAHSPASVLAFPPHQTLFQSYPLWPVMLRVIYDRARREKESEREYFNDGSLNEIKKIVSRTSRKPYKTRVDEIRKILDAEPVLTHLLIKLVAPDVGAGKPIKEILDSTTVKVSPLFSKDFAIVDKDRVHQKDGNTKSGALVGDVDGFLTALFDDESVSCKSICDAARICLENGAAKAQIAVAHGKFWLDENGVMTLKDALKKGYVDKVVTTNSADIPLTRYKQLGLPEGSDRLVVIPTQPLVAEHIRQSAAHRDIPTLFSSRGVLRAYDAVAHRVRQADTGKRDPDKLAKELDLYNRTAKTVLGEYQLLVQDTT